MMHPRTKFEQNRPVGGLVIDDTRRNDYRCAQAVPVGFAVAMHLAFSSVFAQTDTQTYRHTDIAKIIPVSHA